MPQYSYKGRDKEGQLRAGQRFAQNSDTLNNELIKEGIFPIQINEHKPTSAYLDKLHDFFQGKTLFLQEMSVFARQMQLLHQANVPIITALKQLASHTRSHRLATALEGVIEYLEKGQSLATAMSYYPDVFSLLMINIVQIGESTGKLGESFEHLHNYLAFESNTIKQVKAAFRYPIVVVVSITFAIIVMNVFIIPTFSRFYLNLDMQLPWQTRVLIGVSNFFIHYGLFLLGGLIIGSYFFLRWLKSPEGKYKWGKFLLSLPYLGRLLRRIILVRVAQSFAIILSSGIPVNQGLVLIKNLISNAYIASQISLAQEGIERGLPFTQAIVKVDLFAPLEIQILGVGEKNGELSPALNYIANFHTQEIEYDLKRMNDFIGPVLIGAISGLVLIMALGIYLPIWNMINLNHH